MTVYSRDYPSLSKMPRPVGKSKNITPYPNNLLYLSAILSMYRNQYVVVQVKAIIGKQYSPIKQG